MLSAMVIAVLNVYFDWPIAAGILAAVAVGFVIGVVNACIVLLLRINSLIVTLGMGTFLSFVELHIEQGPILEHADLPVAVVNAITDLWHYRVTLSSEQNHAGASPISLRRDAMAGFWRSAVG